MPAAVPNPGDRAFRALTDAVDAANAANAAGQSRPRRPEDADDPDVPVAATVLVLRDGTQGPEVLMIERPDRGSFAGAWVFPGGKLDPEDRDEDDETEEDTARRAGARETREEVGLVLDADDFVTVSRWDPPPGLPLRIRTWFFAVRATDAELVLSADETVDGAWVRPTDILARQARGELTLYPPTWVTLHDLALPDGVGQPDVDALLGFLRLRGVQHYETVARRGPGGPIMLWQGDAEYDPDAAAGELPASARHRLEFGALPWRYTRAD